MVMKSQCWEGSHARLMLQPAKHEGEGQAGYRVRAGVQTVSCTDEVCIRRESTLRAHHRAGWRTDAR